MIISLILHEGLTVFFAPIGCQIFTNVFMTLISGRINAHCDLIFDQTDNSFYNVYITVGGVDSSGS